MEYQKLDRKAVTGWRISRIIGFLVLLGCLVPTWFFHFDFLEDTKIRTILYIIEGVLILYKFIGIFIFPEYEYRQWRYIINDEKVEFRHGIFFVTTTVIPVVRVQHITVSRGPIYRKLGLSKVKIFLASGSFEIIGLTSETAEQISEGLKSKVIKRLDEQLSAAVEG